MQILWNRPAALESFVFDCAVFHHLHQHADYVQRELAKYLSTPAPDDVLDDLIDCRSSLAPLAGSGGTENPPELTDRPQTSSANIFDRLRDPRTRRA
ncbi:MAG TPA: hypothetical protein VEQ38_01675 [Verrucomicrobiae bacterium]|nr:hypothetical protein [Verrucomicrobiae bacterium]